MTNCSVKTAADRETVTGVIGETGVMPNAIGPTDKTDQDAATGRIESTALTKWTAVTGPIGRIESNARSGLTIPVAGETNTLLYTPSFLSVPTDAWAFRR